VVFLFSRRQFLSGCLDVIEVAGDRYGLSTASITTEETDLEDLRVSHDRSKRSFDLGDNGLAIGLTAMVSGARPTIFPPTG
jgi:hypothetical protein